MLYMLICTYIIHDQMMTMCTHSVSIADTHTHTHRHTHTVLVESTVAAALIAQFIDPIQVEISGRVAV